MESSPYKNCFSPHFILKEQPRRETICAIIPCLFAGLLKNSRFSETGNVHLLLIFFSEKLWLWEYLSIYVLGVKVDISGHPFLRDQPFFSVCFFFCIMANLQSLKKYYREGGEEENRHNLITRIYPNKVLLIFWHTSS